VIESTGDRFVVRGAMTTANAVALLEEGRQRFVDDEVRVDLSQVPEIDSAGLSLLLRWASMAAAAGRKLYFLNLDQRLESLAQLYGVGELITRSRS